MVSARLKENDFYRTKDMMKADLLRMVRQWGGFIKLTHQILLYALGGELHELQRGRNRILRGGSADDEGRLFAPPIRFVLSYCRVAHRRFWMHSMMAILRVQLTLAWHSATI